jgi:homogentisate 1,2-dioxygenase
MPPYRRHGDVPPKRHTIHREQGGSDTPCAEELMGVEGFSGASSLLYHRRSPSALVRIDAGPAVERSFHGNQPLRPHHLRTPALPPEEHDDPVLGRTALLGNEQVTISHAVCGTSSGLYRNATGDELAYVQRGTGQLESVFGTLPVSAGDYVVIPAATTHRWAVEPELELLIVEARGHVAVPERYLNGSGQLVEGAPFSERDLRAPSDEPLLVDGDDVPVLVRTRNGLSVHVHASHPFDVIGWDGCLYPWAFNIADFEPIVGRIHQPPPVHQTFAGAGFAVCSFVPRLYDTHPQAVKIPYHHANVDTDEVLFYSAGEFMSRSGSGIDVGSISLHPAGFVHGPQPGSLERSRDADRTEETAVMIDVFSPLGLSDAALRVSDPDYPLSWAGAG